MSVSSVGNHSASLLQLLKEKRNAMKSMVSAVEAGDMAAAQTSATTVQNDQTKIDKMVGNGSRPQTQPAASSGKSLVGDLKGMLNALVSGDKTSASSYASALQSDLDKVLGASSPATGSSTASFLDDLKSLISAVKSGDSAGTETAVTTLAGDVNAVVKSAQGQIHGHHGRGPADVANPQSIMSLLQSAADSSRTTTSTSTSAT